MERVLGRCVDVDVGVVRDSYGLFYLTGCSIDVFAHVRIVLMGYEL